MDHALALRAGLARLQTFAERYVAGVQPRVEGDVSLEPAEGGATTPADLAAEAAGGGLAARVIWSEDGEDLAGCLLWIGDAARLLGGESRAIERLGEDDVSALDAALRLAVEEGGDGELPFEWTALEIVRSDGIRHLLREVGVPDASERARVALRVGDAAQAFLLVPAAESAPADAIPGPGRPEATPEGAPAEASGDVAVGLPTPAAPERAAEAARGRQAARARSPELRNLDHLLDVRLPLTIRLGATRMPLDDVLRLSPGSIVELDHGEDEPLEVLANGRVIARGEVVVVEERFGLRITEIGSTEERLRASL